MIVQYQTLKYKLNSKLVLLHLLNIHHAYTAHLDHFIHILFTFVMVNNVQVTKASISVDFLEILLPLIK